jgi:hypothetical protein
MSKRKKLTRKEKEALPLREDLKIRVLEAKKHLPKSGVTSLFFHYFADEYEDSVKNKSRLNNVLQIRVTDEDITKKLEKLVVLLTPSESKPI